MSFLFYDHNAGQGELYGIDSQGHIDLMTSYSGWRTSWTHLVPWEGQKVLFYDSNAGAAESYSIDDRGGISQLSSTTYAKGWTHIVSVGTPLLFYNSSSGLAQFYSMDDRGGISQLSSTTSAKGWTHIVPGFFIGRVDRGQGTLLFYNSSSGLAQFYSIDPQGTISQLSSTTYAKGWTHIVSVGGALLFYNSSSGLAQFYSIDDRGGISQLSSATYAKGWTHIVPEFLIDRDQWTLLFYNSSSGLVEFYSTDGQGNIHLLDSRSGWRKSWTQIVPIDLVGLPS